VGFAGLTGFEALQVWQGLRVARRVTVNLCHELTAKAKATGFRELVAFWDVGGFATPCTLCNGSDVWQAIKGGAGGAVLGFGGAYEATKSPRRRGLSGLGGWLEKAARRWFLAARRGVAANRRGFV
jgi:hypothetical protein